MLKLFKKRQNIFIMHMHDQAAATLAGMEALVKYFKDQNPEAAAELPRKEKEADEYRRRMIYDLNKTFITPFDR